MLYFLNFRILDFIDILAVALLIFFIYRWIKGTQVARIFLGVGAFFLIYKIVEVLDMHLLTEILGGFFSVGIIALIIVFQQEVRQFLLFIGNTTTDSHFKIFNNLSKNAKDNSVLNSVLTNSCKSFSKTYTGALIILKNTDNLEELVRGGDKMSIEVNFPILESIFYKNSPLHDGAVLIEGNKIIRTRAILPLSLDQSLDKNLGLRHRAAKGLCEKSDAICIVASEETGKITVMVKDKVYHPKLEDLGTILNNYLA